MTTSLQSLIDQNIYDNQESSFRYHLGASVIGRKCDREIWYSWRWFTDKKHDARIVRLFARGHREEDVVIGHLRDAGLSVYQSDPETGDQYRLSALGGHFGGSLDGVIVGIPDNPDLPHLFECKTAGEKQFAKVTKVGVEKEKPEHFAQMQIYMSAFDLSLAVYCVVNKNTDDWYFEIVKFDKAVADKCMTRASNIISSDRPPLRITNDPTWWECKFCDHHAVCHRNATPALNCRTCVHSQPMSDGRWQCDVLPTYKIRTNKEAEDSGKSIVHIPCQGLQYEPIKNNQNNFI